MKIWSDFLCPNQPCYFTLTTTLFALSPVLQNVRPHPSHFGRRCFPLTSYGSGANNTTEKKVCCLSCTQRRCPMWQHFKCVSWGGVLAFHQCDRIPRSITLRGRGLFWLKRFQFMFGWLHCYGPVVKQRIMAERAWWSRAGCLGNREEERGRKRSRGRPPVTYSLQLSPLLQFPPPQ